MLFICHNICMPLYIKSSSSSRHTTSTDIPDPISPPLPIVHWFRQVFRATSRIDTELLYVGSSCSSCFCSSMWRGPHEYIPYEHAPTSLAASHMSGSSNLDRFRDGLVGDHTSAALWGAASMTCSIMLAAFLCSCRQAFSPYV